jgi:Protein of unknown function (DUF1194)
MRLRRLRTLFAAAMALILCQPIGPLRADDREVDLLLVLAADVSRSVDDVEFRLQRDGYAAALTHPKVLRAMTSGPQGRIAVMYLEWSGEQAQGTIVDWTAIAGAADAEQFAAKLRTAPRLFRDRTAIGAAIEYSVRQINASPFKSERHVIDISGDGTNTNGTLPSVARDAAVARGITINAIVILSDVPLAWNPGHTHPPGGLEAYFQENVIGGPGAFTLAAKGFETFGDSIVSKLAKEIAAVPPTTRVR